MKTIIVLLISVAALGLTSCTTNYVNVIYYSYSQNSDGTYSNNGQCVCRTETTSEDVDPLGLAWEDASNRSFVTDSIQVVSATMNGRLIVGE